MEKKRSKRVALIGLIFIISGFFWIIYGVTKEGRSCKSDNDCKYMVCRKYAVSMGCYENECSCLGLGWSPPVHNK